MDNKYVNILFYLLEKGLPLLGLLYCSYQLRLTGHNELCYVAATTMFWDIYRDRGINRL